MSEDEQDRTKPTTAVGMKLIPDKSVRTGVDAEAGVTSRRKAANPTEDECWSAFWRAVAHGFAHLPPQIQQEYARRYPPGSTRAREDFARGTRPAEN